ncbi:HAMP domain-containing sensor histidine kinase [Kitasatospora sp. NPDC007106]|uniref:sensor histidine kinase n=1 Tax=Kitasatospora sp. NPDC007106 TaxID=3156914 RepID=UPI0033DA2D7D
MLTAAAVAVAIALSALLCWFFVKDQLYRQVRANLSGAPYDFRTIANGQLAGDTLPSCGNTPQQALTKSQAANAVFAATHPNRGGPEHGGPNRWDNQLVTTAGLVCLPLGATKAIQTDPGDKSILNEPDNTAHYRDGAFVSGKAAVVRVTKVYIVPSQEPAIMLTAQDVTAVQDSLQHLALVLAGVAAVGVVGAGFIGRIVARSALKPVDQLTDAVEHIARTEEVGTTIPVNGSDEIARLSTSFNSMSTALLNSRERQTRLIADAGHELRTPLTSLRTNVDLLIRSDDTGRPLPPATRSKLLGNMKAQMQELTLLIGDLLQLSRPDSPKPGQNLAVVALHEIAGRAVERARLRGPGLAFDVSVHPWYVHGDAAALERAVINLLDNAVKYSPPGGTVDVALTGGRLTVRDHGPGIPQDELPYVFDRFWRSPSSRQLPGSGLGLSIVAQTVRDTGGEVTLGPAADGGPGALATLQLPGQPTPPQ